MSLSKTVDLRAGACFVCVQKSFEREDKSFECEDFRSEREDFRSERAQDIFECKRNFCVQEEEM